jgi:predicted exporter
MLSNYFSAVYNFIQRRRWAIAGLVGAIVVFSLFKLKTIKYDNNIEMMLPKDPGIQNTLKFLREANFSDKVIISFSLNDSRHTIPELIAAVDAFAATLKGPLVKETVTGFAASSVMPEMAAFLKYTPQLLDRDGLAAAENRLSREAVKQRLGMVYRQSLTMSSSFVLPFLQADPLGISANSLRNIEKLSGASGYQVTLQNNHFFSRDRHHVMIIVKTPVVLTEGFGSRKLLDYLKINLSHLPAFVSADIIAGHTHTVANEDVIKHDIRLTTIIAAAGFLLLFLFCFRDIRAVMIFLAPVVAAIISTNITCLVFNRLSYFVIGMGTVIAGIAIDYCIYVYVAVRRNGNREETIRLILRPLILGALTTVSVFAVFFFSGADGYKQLAFFSNLNIFLCLLFAIFILPHFLRKTEIPAKAAPQSTIFALSTKHDRLTALCWLTFMTLALSFAVGAKFDSDITQFDGTGKTVLSAEERFHEAWGGKTMPAIFVVKAKSLSDAYDINTAAYEDAAVAIGKDNFLSLSAVWPGQKRRRENLANWKKFWDNAKTTKLDSDLAACGKQYNFSADAFAKFIAQIKNPAALETEPQGFTFFAQLKEQFVLHRNDGYQILSFFPDENAAISKLSKVAKKYPGAFLVSRRNFSSVVAHVLSNELLAMAFWAILLTIALTVLLLKNIKLSVLAMLPVVTSLITIAGIIPALGLKFNIPATIASMVVVGIVSDYGMFVVYACRNKYNTGTNTAVSFAATTTTIGTGVLLFAHHPILFSIGITLTVGVLSGYIFSLLVLPALYRLWVEVPSSACK